MARWILSRVEDDDEAHTLVKDAADYPGHPVLTPCQENTVYAAVVDWWATDPTARSVPKLALRESCTEAEADQFRRAILDAVANDLPHLPPTGTERGGRQPGLVIAKLQEIADQYPPDVFTRGGGTPGPAIRDRMLAEIKHIRATDTDATGGR